MAEQEPKELTRDNLKMEMIKIEQPGANLSSCACNLVMLLSKLNLIQVKI